MNGSKVTKESVSAVDRAERPESLKSLRPFLGLINWQKQYNANYSDIMYSLSKSNKQNTNVGYKWDETAERAFQKIKEALISAKSLAHPGDSDPFVTSSDASDVGLGGQSFCAKSKGKSSGISAES